ncbi:polyketide synthase dehydratase domain-containing protein, partial [Siccirubricoccus soli]|uniref:polyketide synthase dehydratase domain-containing protein n=1 Tax=Siccirubricoccus soli TaxID=2899147 RepID=UPI003519148D
MRFAAAIAAAAEAGPALFLEIGPHPILQSYLRDNLRAANASAALGSTLSRRQEGAADPFPAIADRAFTQGADPRSGPAFAGPAARRALPRTPFDRQPHWCATTSEAAFLAAPPLEHPLLGWRRGAEPTLWTIHLDTESQPWLADHRLAGEAVLPAAAMVEMALAAAAAWAPEAAALELTDVTIRHALPLEAGRAREVRATLSPEGAFALASRRRLSEEGWTLHMEARLAALSRLPELALDPPAAAQALAGVELTALAARFGLHYGPAFQPVERLEADAAAGLATVTLRRPEAAPPDAGFLLHPARFDGALQGLIGLLAEAPAEAGAGLVPVRFDRLVARRGAAPLAAARIRLTSRGERSAAADLALLDAAGQAVAVVEGCRLGRIRLPGRERATEAAFRLALVPALPGPGTEPAEPPDLGAALEAARQRDEALDLGEAGLLLEGFCAAAAHEALSSHTPIASPYARALLEDLAEDGLAVRGALGLRPVAAPDLPPAQEIWRQIWLEQPDLAPDLAALALAAEALPGLLAHWPPAEEPAPLPVGPAGLDRLAMVLAEAAAALAAAWPCHRPLRVLEIG